MPKAKQTKRHSVSKELLFQAAAAIAASMAAIYEKKNGAISDDVARKIAARSVMVARMVAEQVDQASPSRSYFG
jgi:hypothetical protein